jgi:hypothetical protein
MASSWTLCHVALVRTDVSEKRNDSFIRVTTIDELGTKLAVTSNQRSVRRLLVTASVVPSSPILVTPMQEALRSAETSVLTGATRRNIPEDTILHSHRRENLKSYIWLLLVHSYLPLSQQKVSDIHLQALLGLSDLPAFSVFIHPPQYSSAFPSKWKWKETSCQIRRNTSRLYEIPTTLNNFYEECNLRLVIPV